MSGVLPSLPLYVLAVLRLCASVVLREDLEVQIKEKSKFISVLIYAPRA
jgi:hypothetical protein